MRVTRRSSHRNSHSTRLTLRVFIRLLTTAGPILLTACPSSTSDILTDSGTIEHGGLARTYRVFAPQAAVDQGNSMPVVLVFHGTSMTGESMRHLTRLDAAGPDQGFLVVIPDAVNGTWNDGRPGVNPTVDDVGFVRSLLDRLAADYPIDTRRVFVAGLSNGGHLCFRLAVELNDRIAGTAGVAALVSETLVLGGMPARPVPVMLVAGDADTISPYNGSLAFLTRSAANSLAWWVAANDSAPGPVAPSTLDPNPNDGTRILIEAHPAGATTPSAESILVTVEGGGHSWPDGAYTFPESIFGLTSHDWNASAEILAFFARQPGL